MGAVDDTKVDVHGDDEEKQDIDGWEDLRGDIAEALHDKFDARRRYIASQVMPQNDANFSLMKHRKGVNKTYDFYFDNIMAEAISTFDN